MNWRDNMQATLVAVLLAKPIEVHMTPAISGNAYLVRFVYRGRTSYVTPYGTKPMKALKRVHEFMERARVT